MNIERNPTVVVASARYVLLPLAQAITGYSVVIDLVGYESWVKNRRSKIEQRE